MARLVRSSPWYAALVVTVVVGGCAGTPTEGERSAREDFGQISSNYRPGDAKPNLPALTEASPVDDFLRYAILNDPRVEAAYYEWAAAVERITTARSLPDPRLTFDADITSMIGALMPGLMMDFPGPGKLAASAEAATQRSQANYYGFERAILRTAVDLKSAYYRLHFLEENLRVKRESLALLQDLERLAQQQSAASRGTLQDVLRAQIEAEQLSTQIENLEDSRSPLRAELKAALGLGPKDGEPPIPTTFAPSPDAESAEVLLATASARNPALREMEADVRSAEAMLGLARKSGVPDFSLGLEADVTASPLMFRPTASVTLPIWRDKIAAEIAEAQAGKRAAESRLDARQITIATDLATMLYLYRESLRDIAVLSERLIPKARQALSTSRPAYATGRAGFLDVIDAQRQLLTFESSLIAARTRRELALASISLTIVGLPPEGAPVLSPEARMP